MCIYVDVNVRRKIWNDIYKIEKNVFIWGEKGSDWEWGWS